MLRFLLAFVLSITLATNAMAQAGGGSRVNQSPDYPGRKLTKQFNTAADSLYNGDPNSGNLTSTSATGKAPNDGLITVQLGDITTGLKLTVWYWARSLSKWVHMGAAATDYEKTFDADYTSAQFAVPGGSAYMITTNTAITTDVYVSGTHWRENNNSATGFEQ